MGLHTLESIKLGVPDVQAVGAYYAEFGLERTSDEGGIQKFATQDGGEQLEIVHAERRRLLEIRLAADNQDDLDRIDRDLQELDVTATVTEGKLTVQDPNSALLVTISVADKRKMEPRPAVTYNGPGRPDRANDRAPGVERTDPVRPRKLGHVVVGSLDQASSERFFTEGIGMKASDRVPGLASFLRCSTDHHNLLLQQAPLNFLHHTAWEVDDVDDVGRGATAMLEDHPERHVWGLGRHHIGSNFFWYLKDPAGNFSEYYSDLDCIVDDQLWKPSVVEGAKGLYSWGPPPPPSFIQPEDLAALMTGHHAPNA